MKTELETFNEPLYSINVQKEPSCFNGFVRVVKYKVTVEQIEEPIEVIHQRLEDLWLKSDNYHDYGPLKVEAKKWGYEFKGGWASQKIKP